MGTNFFFIELKSEELKTINGGGAAGRILGWLCGLPEGYIRFCQSNPDMSETLMNCM